MSTVALADVKTHLNITIGDHDDELQDFIDAAESALAMRVGPLASTAASARVRGGGSSLVLPTCPAVSVTTIVSADGESLTVGDLYLDERAGVVSRDDGAGFGSRWYDVTYQSGRSSIPDDLTMAVKELVRHMWETQRGGATRPGSRASETMANTVPGAAFTLPFRVEQLIAPHVQPGLA